MGESWSVQQLWVAEDIQGVDYLGSYATEYDPIDSFWTETVRGGRPFSAKNHVNTFMDIASVFVHTPSLGCLALIIA